MDKQSKYWIGGAVVSALAVAASIGFSSPGSRLSAVETKVSVLEDGMAEQRTQNAITITKLDAIKEAVDKLSRGR